jgi:hypothetical protein
MDKVSESPHPQSKAGIGAETQKGTLAGAFLGFELS